MEHDVLDTVTQTETHTAVAETGRSTLKTGLIVGGILAATVALGGIAFKVNKMIKGKKEAALIEAEEAEEEASGKPSLKKAN